MTSRHKCTYVIHCAHCPVAESVLITYSLANISNSAARIDRSDCMCIKYLTCYLGCIIRSFMITPAKRKALLASGTLNPHPEAVCSELFHTDFFDPYDFAQVKYEMLRAHSVDEDAVAEVCRQFGLSRESFY